MTRRRLLAVDLDRTLLPNGASAEDPEARPLLAAFVEDLGLTLVFVTGRRLELVEAALGEYALPRPEFVLADVGTSLYEGEDGGWLRSLAWRERLAQQWGGREAGELAPLFAPLSEGEEGLLTLQDPEAQSAFKLSFFAPLHADAAELTRRMRAILERDGLRAAVVHSADEEAGVGLIDVLPERGTKLHALEFLMARRGLDVDDVVFCGDSGNDLEVLVSALPAVLVANADEELRARVLAEASRAGLAHRLYAARGGLLGMNGNYAAGILEGWVHYHPADEERLVELARALPARAGRPGGRA